VVKQLNENNWKPDVSSPESPVYVERKEVKNPVVLPPTPIPEPFITIKLPTKLTVAPKPNHAPPKVPPKSKSKPPAIPKIPQTPSSSFTSSATKKGWYKWPLNIEMHLHNNGLLIEVFNIFDRKIACSSAIVNNLDTF
jgi:hypothetical protein